VTTLRSTLVGLLGIAVPLCAGAQAALNVSTGELRARGTPAVGALTVAPEFTGAVAGLRVWSAGQFTLGNRGGTRSLLETVLTTKRPALLGLSPVVTLRGQDDPLISPVVNRRIDGAFGVSVGTAQLGASAGVGLARSFHAGTDRLVQTSSADVHLKRGAFQFRVGYTGNAFDANSAMPAGPSGFSLSRTRLSDVSSNASWRYRGLEVGGFFGRRLGGAHIEERNWSGGYASLAVNDRIALVARQETAPSDPTRHLAAQRLTSLGFRIRPSLSRARYDDGSDAAQFRREFAIARVHGDQHGIRVYMPDADQVDLAASFTEWTPTAMRRAGGGWWELVVPLAPGLHSLNVRSDSGKWVVPPGLDVVADEFNGSVGVLVIK
jgi:hypothetical protein